MSQQGGPRFGSYRCPVCSYRDLVELERTALYLNTNCVNCGTSLEVAPRELYSLLFQAQIVELRSATA